MIAPVRHDRRRDEGSVLTLVLVFMVIGSLILLPLMSYAATVLRANSVAVKKTETMERLRGGARVAVADPADLFVRCAGGSTPIPIAGALVPGTSSTCRQISSVTVLDQLEVPYGGVAVQLGESVPANVSYSTRQPAPTAATNWWGDPADTSCDPTEWCPDPKQDTIWMPRLPEVATSVQTASGYPMPAPRDCLVYFPGTYDAPVVIDGPTYFVSGVYLFNSTLTVVGGADAVFGFGLAEGCVGNDAAAVLEMYPNALPDTLNSEGNGATLLFGDEGRLVVDDSLTADGSGNLVPNAANLPVRFEVNQRYIQDVSDTAARVSIMSVNGDRDVVDPAAVPLTYTTGTLDVPSVIRMPESQVRTSTGTLVSASSKGLKASNLTAEPRVPEAPKNVTATALDDPLYAPTGKGATLISWDPPVGNDEGGSTITNYRAVNNAGTHSCETDGATFCVVRNLNHGGTYTFTVTATNAVGTSAMSAPVSVMTSASSTDLAVPGAPTAVTVANPATWRNQAAVSWTAPASTGNAHLIGYRVEAYRAFADDVTSIEQLEATPFSACSTWSFRNQPAATSCVVSGLTDLDPAPGAGPLPATHWVGYRFRVVAINAVSNQGLPGTPVPPGKLIGESAPSAWTDPPVLAFTGTATAPAPTAPVWPVAPTYVPDPIVDVRLASAPGSTVTIAGYISVPQGRVRVHNPTGQLVRLSGGLVAGAYDVDAATIASMADPASPTTIGFEDIVLQRTIEILTRVGGERHTSRLRVQINANGADMSINSWVTQ